APIDKVAPLLQRFAEGAREVGRRPETQTRVIRLHVSWAPSHDEAVAAAMREWPNAGMRFPKSDIRSPLELEQIARTVQPEHFGGRVLITDAPEAHRAHIQRYLVLGFDRVYLHGISRDQPRFLEVFGRDVL